MENNSIIFIDGKTYLKAKASIVPTSKDNDNRDKSQVYRHSENKRLVVGFMNARSSKDVPQRVYITTDEKIQEDDRVLLYTNDVVTAVDFIGHIGYKEIGGTKFKNFLPMIEKKIITSKLSLQFIHKLIETNLEPVNIDVLVELVGGNVEEVIEPIFGDEVVISYKNTPYRVKFDADGFPIVHLLKNNWNKEDMTQMLIKAISECNSEDGCLKDADPLEASKWVNNMLFQIDK